MMAGPDANNATTAAAGTNNDINLVRPTASNTTTYANAGAYGGQMPGPNNYFGNPFFMSQMWMSGFSQKPGPTLSTVKGTPRRRWQMLLELPGLGGKQV